MVKFAEELIAHLKERTTMKHNIHIRKINKTKFKLKIKEQTRHSCFSIAFSFYVDFNPHPPAETHQHNRYHSAYEQNRAFISFAIESGTWTLFQWISSIF